MNLPSILFWDTDYANIDWDAKARYVIERVVMYGNTSEWRAIQKYYGMDCIKKEMLQSINIDAKTLNFLSVIFNIPKTQFRCLTQIQSQQGHWSY